MPVSGLHVGEMVLSPSGRLARVVSVNTTGASTARVKYGDTGETRVFRQGALRRATRPLTPKETNEHGS